MDDESRQAQTIPIGYSQKTYKNQSDPKFGVDPELYRSNSANDLLDLKEKENKNKIKTDSSKKKRLLPRTISAKTYFDHYDINNCEHCYGIDNMLKKDKSKLSDFIENNSSFLKLFGNPRYDKSSPFLFVEDHKNRIDDDRIGLLPIPSKPRLIMKSKDENNRLYEIQRKVVMMRRFQYGKQNNSGEGYYDEDGEDFFEKIRKIQLWWKQMYKIIYIQKVFRGYRIRKRVNFILNFIDIMNKWQRLLDNIKARRALRDLVNKSPKALPNNNNYKGYDYMSKVRRTGKPFLNKDDDDDSDNNKKNNINNDNLYKNYINNGNKFNNRNEDKKDNDDEKNNDSGNKIYDKYINGENYLKGLKDLNKYSKAEPKNKVLLNKNGSFFTKIYYDKNVIDKINKIGKNVKDFLRNKNNLKKKNIIYDENNKEQNGLYIDKNYIPKYYKNVIDFNNIMKNALQKAYFRKRPDNKKNEEDEDPDNKDKNGDKNDDNKNGVDEDPNNKDKNGDNNDDKDKSKNLNDDDENKNIINPNNDFNFKNKNCYIEKIRKLKDNNNKEKDKNKNSNKDDDGTKDNKGIDNNNKDNYNTNKSVNNQNDLFNMYLDVSEPKTVEYLNSEKKPKPLELSISDNNNFSFNNAYPNKNKNKNENENEDKNKEEDVAPLKKNKFKDDNCFISKENIKDVSKDLNKLQNKIKQFLNNKNQKENNLKDKNNKNNFTIESKSTLNYLGNSKDKTDTSKDISKDTTNDDKKSKKQYIIDLKERFNFKGNSTNFNNNNMNNNINKNDNLTIESNNWLNYPKEPNMKNKNISDNLVVDSNVNVNYEGNDKNDDGNIKNDLDELNKNLKEESILNMNYKGNNKSKYMKKKRNLMIQKNSSFNYLRSNKEIINNNIDFNKNNLIIQSDYRFNYLSPYSDHQDILDNFVIQSEAGFDCPGIKKDKNKKKKKEKEKEEYLIDPNSKLNLNYIGNKENDDDDDDKNKLNNWNNNLNVDNHLNINYLRNSKNKDDNKTNKNNLNNWNNNLNIENNPIVAYEGNDPNNLRNKNKNNFNEDNLIGQPNINLNYEGVKPKSDDKKEEDDMNNKNMEDFNKIQKIPEINKNLCYISKIRKELSSGKSYESRYNENLILKKDNNNNMPKNGLLITKLRLKNNLDKIKLIQDAIRKYLLNKDINNKEKIYKKPLFNQFYYYEDESPYEKKNKNKKKPKNGDENNKNKKNNKNKDDKDDDKNLKNKNNEENGDDDDGSDPNKKKNKNNNDNEEGNESGGSTVRYVKKNIPGKNMAEIYRLKPNHLLKIVKIQKGKSILEKLILSGTPKYLPQPPKKKGKEEEDDIRNEYKSKTPNKVKRHKKYDEEEEDDKGNDKNNKNKKNGGKNDINEELKNYLSKSHMDGIEDDELNDNENDGNMTDYEDDPLRKNRIKKLKNNMGNYFYMSKIRKGDIDDESIRKIQNKYKAFQNKDKDGNKTESDELNKDKDKVMPNIVKNNCYYDKVKINNDTHEKFLERANNLYKDKVYKIGNNWKDSKSKDDGNDKVNYNNSKLDYITKQRHGNFNLNKNDNKNQINELSINKNLCLITKERKINSVSLPNKNYKNSHHYITKERRAQNQNDNLNNNLLLSTKNYSFKIMNNNNNCIITKERKTNTKANRGILLPRKEGIFISKIREKENMNQIKTIQNLFKKKNKKKDDKNKYLYNNEDQNAFIPRRKFYLKNLDDSDDTTEIEKDNYYLCGYYSKVYKRNIYKYYPAKNVRCYITKEKKKNIPKNEKNNKNYSFLSLLEFFAKKNVQEYIYPKLFDKSNPNKSKVQDTSYNFDTNHNPIDDKLINNDENFTYPKYYKNLKRIYNFYKTKKRGESPKAKKIYLTIIPDIEQCKSLNDLITKINADPSKSNKLINNLDKRKVNENDLIDEMGEFAKYDKNLSNGGFIKNKLKEDENLKKNGKNLFNLIKKVDDEYNNLINGKYCYRCGKELTKCKCDDINSIFKDTDESKDNFGDMNDIGDEDLDFNMGGDDCKKKRINYFEYDSNKSKGILIKGKPKLNDYLSSPMNNLVIYNQQQLNEINQRVKDKAKNSMNRFINTSNNNINDLQSNQSNSSNSGVRYNNRYSNYTNTNNYNNTSNLNNDSVNYNYNRNNINNSISSGNNRNTYTYNNTQKSSRNNNENTSNRGYTYNRSNNNYNK